MVAASCALRVASGCPAARLLSRCVPHGLNCPAPPAAAQPQRQQRSPSGAAAPVTGALMEYSATFMSGRPAISGLAGRPQLASRCSSTRSTPHTIRLMSLPQRRGARACVAFRRHRQAAPDRQARVSQRPARGCARTAARCFSQAHRTPPPPMRALTSIRRGPRLVALSSTWNTPSLKPST